LAWQDKKGRLWAAFFAMARLIFPFAIADLEGN
jgi:hypothetical protein